MSNESRTPTPNAVAAVAQERVIAPVKKYRHLAWSVLIVISLVVFIIVLPGFVRDTLTRAVMAQGYLAGLVMSFGLLSLSLFWVVGNRLDAWVFTHVNIRGRRPRWLDLIMLTFTQIGNGLFAFCLTFIFFIIGERRISYELLLGTLTVWLVVELVKASVRRPRPFEKIEQARIVGYRESGRSYPSGHTTQAFFLATLLSQYYGLGGWTILLYFLAGFVAITRIYVGAHYPRDVLAGAILGAAWGLIGLIIDQRFFVGNG